jgi:RND superfamily putative drug exporter
VVLGVWVLVFGAFGWLAGFIQQVQDNNETNWMPASAQSTMAVRLADRQFPGADTAPIVVVYARDGGLTGVDRVKVGHDRGALAELADGRVTGPDEAADGAAVTLTVPVANSKLDNGDVDGIVARARAVVRDGLPPGLTADATGAAAGRADAGAANARIDTSLTLATVGVVAVLLLITYRSPVLLFVPLVCVVCGVVVAQGGTYLAGRAGAVVSGSSFILMIVLVFGLGTDYALLLISRYREESRRYPDRHEAMAVAVRRTTPTVAASAAPMILASSALLAADMNSTKGLGPIAAIAVAAALLVMTTLLPALLVVLGRSVFWPRVSAASRRSWTLGTGRPRRTWVCVALALAALGTGGSVLKVGALNGADNFTDKPESVLGQQVLAAHYPAGSAAPALIYGPARSAGAIADAARATPGVVAVAEPETSGSWTRIPAVLRDPPDSSAARRTVRELRGRLVRVDGHAIVGGQAATGLDQNDAMNRDLAVLVPIIMAIVVVLLGLLLRAVVAPLLLLACALLSACAALGLSTVVYHALGFPRTDQTVLTLGFLFLVALGVDYTVFLMARAREEVRRLGHRAGVLHAVSTTGGVITSAAVVLAATFLVLTITAVVLNIELGLLVALGVLIDGFVVRTILVPALVLDVGIRTWWPYGSGIARPARYANTTN